MSNRIPSVLIVLSLVTLALVPAASAAAEVERPADVELTTTQDHEIPICVTTPSPDPKGEREICVAVVEVPHVCIRTGPDAKADEICLSHLIAWGPTDPVGL